MPNTKITKKRWRTHLDYGKKTYIVLALLAIIVSDHIDEITASLMDMGLGATILHGHGAYTGQSKRVLMCAARPSKIGSIKAAVSKADPEKAFIIVCDAREVFGEGFGEYGEDAM